MNNTTDTYDITNPMHYDDVENEYITIPDQDTVIDNWGIDDEIDALVTSCLVSDYPHKRKEVLEEAGATNVSVFVGERDSFGPVTMVMQGEYRGKRFDILD